MRPDNRIPKGRIAAAKAGSRFYRAAPCPKNHDGLRYTSSGNCVQCAKAYAKAYDERVRRMLAGQK